MVCINCLDTYERRELRHSIFCLKNFFGSSGWTLKADILFSDVIITKTENKNDVLSDPCKQKVKSQKY